MGPSWSWRKSSYSDMQGNQCVEIARIEGGDVLVRDTKDTSRGRLAFTVQSWSLFLAAPSEQGRATAGR
ncbi:DUF397 domain-containing protein [Streptomyces sp. ADMS]|uniref:DUF397 domain-containing protein n=1 Tax=Streptomyces sp. ADMS TaxID=3071415 RepID=UPI00296F5D02|nr:DUF397 domain-containing protein [Streptomyces sp. ADMS]MDW4908015.1 DUF397 domain-containing protein [Streptomyces sp. ADMS]